MDPYHDSSDAEGEVDPEYAAGGGVLDPSLGVSVCFFASVSALGRRWVRGRVRVWVHVNVHRGRGVFSLAKLWKRRSCANDPWQGSWCGRENTVACKDHAVEVPSD